MTLAIVQSAGTAAAGTNQPAANWGSTPTQGNLMIAFGYLRNGSGPSPINGWAHAQAFKATANWNLICYAKYAGASESKTAAVDANTYPEWGLNFWEISGVTGQFWKDFIKATFGTQGGAASSLAIGSITPNANTTLLLAGIAGQFALKTDTITWPSSPWTADDNFVSQTADGFGVFNFAAGGHQLAPSGAQTCTPTTSVAATAWTGGYVELGSSSVPSPALDGITASAQNGSASITSISANVGTISGSDVILAIVAISTFAASGVTVPSVTSVTATGLTFAKRFQSNPQASSTNKSDFEVWWAPSLAPFSGSVTANISGASNTQNFAVITVLPVGGANNYLSPFDSNGGLPFAGATPQSWSTTQATDFVFGVGAVYEPSSLSDPAVSGGVTWTAIVQVGTALGAAGVITDTRYSNTSSPQSGVSTSAAAGQLLYIDAITANATSSTETATVGLAIAGVKFSAGVVQNETGAGTIAIGKPTFAVNEAKKETTLATVAIAGLKFSAHAAKSETGTATVAIAGVVIAASAFDINALNPIRQFSTFG